MSSSSLSSGDVEDDQLLVGREPDPVGAGGHRQVGHLGQDGARHAAGDRGDAHGVQPVLQLLHADVVDVVRHLLGRGAVDQRALEVLGLEDLAELLTPQSLTRNFSRALDRSRR